MAARSTVPKRQRSLTAEDLFNLRVPTSVTLSPDEQLAAYSVEWIDKNENTYFTNLHLLDLRTGTSRQFTHGNHVDGQAVWSPDGATIAFVSTRDKKTGIYLMPVSGGAERKLIEIDGSIERMTWSPSGGHLVFSLRYNDSHFEKDEKKKGKPPVFRHITRLWYRLDGLGFLPQDKFQVHTFDLETAELRKLTSGTRDNLSPSVSPDGKWICYVSNREKEPDLEGLRDTLFLIPFAGGKEKKLKAPEGPKALPTFSPNGKSIAYIGHDNPEDDWGSTVTHIWRLSVSGKPAPKDLLAGWDRSAYDQSLSDTSDVHGPSEFRWSGDGKRILFVGSDTGTTNLFYVSANGGKPTRFFRGDCHIKGFSVNGRTRTAAMIYADLDNPGEIVVASTQYGAEKKARKLTDLNGFLRRDIKLGKSREVWFKSFDSTDVQGWLVTPPDFSPNKKYPAILEIHGGPRTQYAFTFMHEMQLLAARGYVVLYTNPRGGSGRGETWARAISGGWGGLDYADCDAATDYMVKLKYVDANRLGVTGGSYGGYMTNWIIGQNNRFKAAVTQRSVVDLRSFVGSSDFGFSLMREFDGWPWDNEDNYKKCSPLTYFKNVKTPVLIIHSEQDLRCAIEQAEQMFVMLKVLGKTVEMVRFPEEPHGLSRHGRPDRRLARLEWILKWFDRYLLKRSRR